MKPSCRRVLAALIDAHVYGLTAVQLAHPSIAGRDCFTIGAAHLSAKGE